MYFASDIGSLCFLRLVSLRRYSLPIMRRCMRNATKAIAIMEEPFVSPLKSFRNSCECERLWDRKHLKMSPGSGPKTRPRCRLVPRRGLGDGFRLNFDDGTGGLLLEGSNFPGNLDWVFVPWISQERDLRRL